MSAGTATRWLGRRKVSSDVSYAGISRITSKFLSEDFAPDCDLEKTAWQLTGRARLDCDWAGRKTDVKTQVASLWSAARVYFAFWCDYSVLNVYEGEDSAGERWGLWDRDVVEVFLNPEPERVNHYYEFEVAPNNQWIDLEIDLDKKPFNDAGWNSGFEHATRIDSERRMWTTEMSIPLASLKVKQLRLNTEWRINFYRADGLGDDTERRFLCWSPVYGEKPNFHVPARFGIIEFRKG